MPDAWMPGVEAVPTEAFGGYADVPNGSMQWPIAVMSHIMQGYQRTMISWANERPFATPKSAHFSIGRDGRIVQHVSRIDPAWAAGHVERPTWPLYRPGTNPNKYTIHIEHEGFSTPPGYGFDYVYDDAHPWPSAMVESSIAVQRWVMSELGLEPGPDTVIGHYATDGVNRLDDPGKAWPRGYIISRLRQANPAPPVEPPPPPTDLPSPAIGADTAFLAVADAYFPAYNPGRDTRLVPLIQEGSRVRYELSWEA